MTPRPLTCVTLRQAAAMVAALALLIGSGSDRTAEASAPQFESVRVVVPPTVSFSVPDIGVVATAGSPVTVSFSLAVLSPGRVLRVSVKADGPLVSSSGTSVAASNVAWTTSNIVNGVGVNGVLGSGTYGQVFESQLGALSGRVDLTWTLSLPQGTVRAETLQTTLRWKLESITP